MSLSTPWPRHVDGRLDPVAGVGLGGEFGWGGEPVAFGSWPAGAPGAWRGALVGGGVASQRAGQVPACQVGVGAVGAKVQLPVGEPVGEFGEHVGGVFNGGRRVLLLVQPGVDRRRDRHVSPRWDDTQGDHDQVQAKGIDDPVGRGPHRVAEGPCAGDPPAAFVGASGKSVGHGVAG
jgi:hypothetical protein